MKKFLCVFLSLVMALSMATFAFAADDSDINLPEVLAGKIIDDDFIEAFNGKTLDIPDNLKEANGTYDIDKLIRNGSLSGVEFLGMDIAYMYDTNPLGLDWGKLSVSHTDMGTLWGEMNTYMVSFLKPNYTNTDRMCTGSNATAICNFIGRLLNPSFQNQTIDFSQSNYTGGTRDYTMKRDFYMTISNRSGLTQLITKYWLRQVTVSGVTSYERKINYLPLLIGVLDVPLYNENGTSTSWGDMEYYFTTPSKEYKVPAELGGFIIKSVIENAINDGPIQYLLNSLKTLIDNYTLVDGDVYKSVSALLTDKINAGYVTAEGLKTFGTLFNTLSNNNSRSDSSHLQFVTFPAYRFSKSKDNTEAFLYLMAYLNLVGKHLYNANVVNGYKAKISASSEINGTKKKHLNMMIDAMFFGDMSELAKNMRDISQDNLHNVGNNWLWNFGDFYARMINAIAAFFDGIFRTLKNGINLDIF